MDKNKSKKDRNGETHSLAALSEVEYLRRRREMNMRLLLIIVVLAVGIFITLALKTQTLINSGEAGVLIAVVSSVYSVFGVMYFYLRYRSSALKLDEALERFYIRKRLLPLDIPTSNDERSEARSDTDDAQYFEKLVAINVENLSTYYIQVKEHANKGFTASIVMGVLGFALLSAGLVYGFSAGNKDATITYLTFASGAVIEFVSAVFFYIYNKTVTQMKDYHDSLLYVQNILLSLKLVDGISDQGSKDAATSQIIDYLINRGRVIK